jgi:hypothetical protein
MDCVRFVRQDYLIAVPTGSERPQRNVWSPRDAPSTKIAAITGHASLREIARYTKAADQPQLAGAAMEKVSAKQEQKTVKPWRGFDK